MEQVIRPTGLLDPTVEVKPTKGQIDDLLEQIRARVERGERCLVTTLTKRMAEELADYLREMDVKVHYLHSEVNTLERSEILRDLRLGVYDVVVGINLLREGLDLPEVSLVAILDADKEGYLRSASSLIQTLGRAARHVDGHAIMYADRVTDSMRHTIDETYRRRAMQEEFNRRHNITPEGNPQGGQGHHRAYPSGGGAQGGLRDPPRPLQGRHGQGDQGPGGPDETGRRDSWSSRRRRCCATRWWTSRSSWSLRRWWSVASGARSSMPLAPRAVSRRFFLSVGLVLSLALLALLTLSGCSGATPGAPQLPPGFERGWLPGVDVRGYIYVAPGRTVDLPLALLGEGAP